MQTKFYSRIITLSAILFFSLTTLSRAEPSIGLFLSSQTYTVGGSFPVVSITAQNLGTAVNQDVHIAVISPQGTIYEYPNWNTALQPWLPAFTIPANLQLGNTVITDLSNIPGGLTQGIWQAVFALTNPGTLEINQIKQLTFNVVNNSTPVLSGNSRFGTINLIRSQASIAGFDNTSVIASAVFSQINTVIPNIDEEQITQVTELDQCTFISTEINSDIINQPSEVPSFTFLDAGDISISGNALNKISNSSVISYSANFSTNFFDNADNFNFIGTGSPDVGAFNFTVPSTKVIELLSPSLATPPSIDSSQDLVLRWTNNNNGNGEFVAILTGTAIDLSGSNPSSTASGITCRFVDDGQGTIPASLLRQLQQATNSEIEIDLPIDVPGSTVLNNSLVLSLTRTNLQFFTTSSPILNFGTASVTSGFSTNVDFK